MNASYGGQPPGPIPPPGGRHGVPGSAGPAPIHAAPAPNYSADRAFSTPAEVNLPWARVSSRLVWHRRLAVLLQGLLAGAAGALLIARPAGPIGAAAWGVGVLVACGVAWVVAGRSYRSWGYAERPDDLLVTHGVFVRRLVVVPYGRMQFVDVTAGLLERWMGIATVRMHTAAAATDARIPGLPAAEAAQLRDRLARRGEARSMGL